MAADVLQYAIGNAASTTPSASMSDSATTLDLTSDTNFNAKSGEGMVLLDEGLATEEFGYATGKTGSTLTIPLANRGLEGGSAQAHTTAGTVKGIITAGMWNNLVDSLVNLVSKTTGAVDGTKVMKITSTDGQLATGGNIQVNSADPWRTIELPAGAWSPTTTSGCGIHETVEAGTNDIDYKVLPFDASSDENAFCNFQMPASWDAGAVQFRYVWTNAGGGAAETTVFELSGRGYSDSDAIDQAVGTPIEVSDTWLAQGDVHISAWSGDVTLAGTLAAGQWVHLELMRDVSEDNLTGDARLIGVQLRYKQAQYSD